ncbi:MAG: hypothetical protein QW762_02455, partial [Candidatus Thermoplasmatota archaeon]
MEITDRGDFIPLPILKNFIKTSLPLLYVIARNPKAFARNAMAWKKRLNAHRKPWVHLDDESMYDSTKILKEEDFKDLPPVSDEKYL